MKVDQNDRTTDQGKNFYNINPHGYIPALELEDGNLQREAPVTVQYLADRRPEAGLAPANGTFARYRLQEMFSFLSTEIHKGFIPLPLCASGW
ncbi:hypothetical protein LJR011_000189 [Agrobacterium tumefaciens]